LRVFKQKRPEMAAWDRWFHWDNTLVYTAVMVMDWMAARQFQVIQHPPYSMDLAPANFLLFLKVKRELACLTSPRRPSRRSGGKVSGLCQ
jgi:hypothetical protein